MLNSWIKNRKRNHKIYATKIGMNHPDLQYVYCIFLYIAVLMYVTTYSYITVFCESVWMRLHPVVVFFQRKILMDHEIWRYPLVQAKNMFFIGFGHVESWWRLDVHFEVSWSGLPSGKQPHNYGKSPCWMGKSTISMAIFNSKLFVYQRV